MKHEMKQGKRQKVVTSDGNALRDSKCCQRPFASFELLWCQPGSLRRLPRHHIALHVCCYLSCQRTFFGVLLFPSFHMDWHRFPSLEGFRWTFFFFTLFQIVSLTRILTFLNLFTRILSALWEISPSLLLVATRKKTLEKFDKKVMKRKVRRVCDVIDSNLLFHVGIWQFQFVLWRFNRW